MESNVANLGLPSPRSMATSVLMPTPASSEKFQLIDLQTLPALFNHLS
jgi:hypothetical protein